MARESRIRLDKYPEIKHIPEDCFICQGVEWNQEANAWESSPAAKKHQQQKDGGQ